MNSGRCITILISLAAVALVSGAWAGSTPGYLPILGPTALRFQSVQARAILPPLQTEDHPSESRESEIISGTNQPAASVPVAASNTVPEPILPAAVSSNSTNSLPPLMFGTRGLGEGPDRPLITPQMLMHFLTDHNGMEHPGASAAPVVIFNPPPPPSSSATYQSPSKQ